MILCPEMVFRKLKMQLLNHYMVWFIFWSLGFVLSSCLFKIFPTRLFMLRPSLQAVVNLVIFLYLARNTVVPFTPQRCNEHQTAEPIPGLGDQQVYSLSYILNLVLSVPFQVYGGCSCCVQT